MVKVKYHGEYQNDLESLLDENPDLSQEINQRTKWFQRNPEDTRLENHPLRKSLEGKWAFSVTEDIRIVYQWLGKTSVRFLSIGRHVRVYAKY